VQRVVAHRLQRWVRCVLDLPEDVAVQVSQLRCRDAGCAPLETVLAVLRPGAPLARTVPLPADQICATDVLHAFAAAQHDPGSTP
jgi:hypothetical protein